VHLVLVGAHASRLVHPVPYLHAAPLRGVGRIGGEPPNLRRIPDEYGGTARAPKGLARGTGGRVPGMVRSPHAVEHTQPRVHSSVKDASCVQHPRAVLATGGLDRIL